MPPVPRDYSDLFLAPVALSVDDRLFRLGQLGREEMHLQVVLESNAEARTRAQRAQAVVHSVTYLLDMHGWDAAWDPRGVRLSHGDHALVLGVPAGVVDYVTELPEG